MNYIINSFLNIRISDVLDIIIVAFLLYKFFNYIKQTRAMNLLKGMIIILLVWGIAEIFDFMVVKFLIRNLMTLGLIFLVIVFQPELRFGLEKLGRGGRFIQGAFSQGGKDDKNKRIDEIVFAVEDLALAKMGALIVIERESPLGDIIETGQKINARINASLINNLFFKNSPLHDGAIVISNWVIVAAACILPLSNNTNINKNLGTRHRAALGISERSDAVVIIVSEETGTISVASDGKLARFVDIRGLKSLLNSKFSVDDKSSVKKKFKFFKKNYSGE